MTTPHENHIQSIPNNASSDCTLFTGNTFIHPNDIRKNKLQ
jgi:hypothetical protein